MTIELVEEAATVLDALGIGSIAGNDALQQRQHPRRFAPIEFLVVEVEVVDDLGDGLDAEVFGQAEVLHQRLEGAAIAPVAVAQSLEHIEQQLTLGWPITLCRNEFEARPGIDET